MNLKIFLHALPNTKQIVFAVGELSKKDQKQAGEKTFQMTWSMVSLLPMAV